MGQCYFPNVLMTFYCWSMNEPTEEYIKQLFCKCYFSNVQMTFSLSVARQVEKIEQGLHNTIVFQMLFS